MAHRESDWEAFQERCLTQLEALAGVGASRRSADALSLHLAADFQCSELVPSVLRTVLDRPYLVVQEGGPRPHAPADAAMLEREFQRIGEGIEASTARRSWTTTYVGGEPARPTTRAKLRLSGQAGEQQIERCFDLVAEWEWTGGAEAARLAFLRLESYVETRAPKGAWFEDVTAQALRYERSFVEQLLPPLDDFVQRVDRNWGMRADGMHGMALGDADGDGLLDVYLPQPGGLPNKLYLQRADGTLADSGSASNADILEASSAALWADFDNDGDLDLATQAGAWIVLLANDGRARFELAQKHYAPLATALSAADVNLDGDLDLYVCCGAGPSAGMDAPKRLFDPDNGPPNLLLENQSNSAQLSFRTATIERGLDDDNRHFSRAAAFADFDVDGDQDLYVANDFGRDALYVNDGGHFTSQAGERGLVALSPSSGVAWADFNLDGRLDVLTSPAFAPRGLRLGLAGAAQPGADPAPWRNLIAYAAASPIWLQDGAGHFEPAGRDSRLSDFGHAFGAIGIDFDNDGKLDLFMPNGYRSGRAGNLAGDTFWSAVVPRLLRGADATSAWRDLQAALERGESWGGHERQRSYLSLASEDFDAARSAPEPARFLDVSGPSGLDSLADGRSAAAVDWDRDGRLDLLLASRGSPRFSILRNTCADPSSYVAVRLIGTSSNRDAVGARVEVRRTHAPTLVALRGLGVGTLADAGPWLHFGLGSQTQIEELAVVWPGGEREVFQGARAGARWILRQHAARAEPTSEPPIASGLGGPKPELTSSPPGGARGKTTVLAARIPLPAIGLEDELEQPTLLLRAGEKARIVVLYSAASPADTSALEAWAKRWGKAPHPDWRLTAVCADPKEQWDTARRWIESVRWPFAAAFPSENSLGVLDALQRATSDACPGMALPCALWIDEAGALAAVTRGPPDPAELPRMLEILAVTPQLALHETLPFRGRRLLPPPEPPFERFLDVLERGGFDHEANELLGAFHRARSTNKCEFALRMGRGRWVGGEREAACELFAQAVQLDPTHLSAREAWALALGELGRFEEALNLLRETVRLFPHNDVAQAQLVRLLVAAGRDAQSERELETLAELSPSLAAQHKASLAQQFIARAQRRFQADDFLAALTDFELAIERDATLAEAWAGRGMAERRLVHGAASAEHLRFALNLDGTQLAWKLELGLTLVDLGQFEQARQLHAELLRSGYARAVLLEQALQQAQPPRSEGR